MRAIESSSFREPDILGRPPKRSGKEEQDRRRILRTGSAGGAELWKPCYKNWDKKSELDS